MKILKWLQLGYLTDQDGVIVIPPILKLESKSSKDEIFLTNCVNSEKDTVHHY